MKYIKILFIVLTLFAITNIEAFAVVTNTKPNVQQTIPKMEKMKYCKNYLVYLRNTLIQTCGYDEELLKSNKIKYKIEIDNRTGEIIRVVGEGSKNVDFVRGELRIKRLQRLKPYDKRYNISFSNLDVVYHDGSHNRDVARFNISLNSPEYNLRGIYCLIYEGFHSNSLRTLSNVEHLSATARVKLKFDCMSADGYTYKTQWKPVSVTLLNSSGDPDFDELMISHLKKETITFGIVPNDTMGFDITLYGHWTSTSNIARGNIRLVE